MRRKNLAVAVLTLALLFSSLQGAILVSANYFPPPSIEIYSPIPAPDVHSTASVPLQVRVNVLTDEADISFIRYSLDGGVNISLTNLTREDGLYYWTTTEGVFAHGNAFRAEASLDNLAEGNHTLVVYSHATDGKEMSQTREFIVDYDYVPPQNPFGSPSFPNGTSTLPTPTAKTGILEPLENPVALVVIACVGGVLLLLGLILLLKKKSAAV